MPDLRNFRDGIPERVVPSDLSRTTHGAEHLARYLFAGHWAAGQRVVDLCCGVGYGTNLLAAAGAERALGIDISGAAIAEADRLYAGRGIDFQVADVTSSLDLRRFQLRVCFEGIEHVVDHESLMRNLRAELPSAGVAIISTPNVEAQLAGERGNPHHVREYTFEQFRTLVHEYFTRAEFFAQWRYPYPFDVAWNGPEILRALLPLSFRRALRPPRFRRDRRSPPPPRPLAAAFRPFPVTNLSAPLPGLRYGPPSIWLAVCCVD